MQNSTEETTGDITLRVNTTDPKTGDTSSDTYVVHDVRKSIAEDLDGGNYDGIFQLLFREYPDDFPEEEPGVDAEIIAFDIDWEDFN